MSQRWIIAFAAAVAVGVVVANAFFIVDQRRQAVVLKLGEPVRLINPPGADDPGLKIKIPFVERVVGLDKRNQSIEAGNEVVMSADHRPLRIDAFARYRITDPLAFYRALGDESTAKGQLEPLIGSSLRRVLGAATAADIISRRRSEVMGDALQDVRARAAAAHLGIDVIDLRLTRVDLPEAYAQNVYQRVRAAWERKAAMIRSQGEATAHATMANADREVTVTRAKADEEAAVLRGAGDAQAASLYAASYGRDPRFADFYLSMQAYEKALARGDTTLVLSADSDFFKYLKNGPNAR